MSRKWIVQTVFHTLGSRSRCSKPFRTHHGRSVTRPTYQHRSTSSAEESTVKMRPEQEGAVHSYKQISLAALAIGVTVLATAVTGKERVLVYATFDVPGAIRTSPQGINSKGDIVGGFVDSAGQQHGFLLSDGVFTKIDYPGAEYTDARGLNSRGEIVGAYRMPGEPSPSLSRHGYLRTRHGEFLPADFPGHINTIPQRITSRGLILGCRHDTDFMETMRGVTLNARDSSEFTEIDAFASMHNGATPDGSLIVGLYMEMDTGRRRGYLLYGDTFIPFDVPGSTGTQAWDVNPRGAVVGDYQDASRRDHGFLWDHLQFTSVDYPAATATRARGINSHGDIVGYYADAAGRTHGFVANRMRDDGEDR
ncbi:MAG: hypothetical protein DMF92_12555 [Acidobacteria bacterium]|nr:MAG: hypothetical protein DMF92_12555 [Acidobacteriota bacterium]